MRYLLSVLVVLALVLAWFIHNNRQLHGDLERVSQELKQTKETLLEQASVYERQQRQQLKVQRALEKKLQTNTEKHLSLKKVLEGLKDEKDYKQWASDTLPDGVKQLLKRKTASGASEYLKQLPNRKPLPAKSSKSKNQ